MRIIIISGRENLLFNGSSGPCWGLGIIQPCKVLVYQRQGKRRGRHAETSALNAPSLESETFCLTLCPPDPLSVILYLKSLPKDQTM
jgi:hypothetical protein